jgi:hypothetical protein
MLPRREMRECFQVFRERFVRRNGLGAVTAFQGLKALFFILLSDLKAPPPKESSRQRSQDKERFLHFVAAAPQERGEKQKPAATSAGMTGFVGWPRERDISACHAGATDPRVLTHVLKLRPLKNQPQEPLKLGYQLGP